ncbi:hemerythrin domain-containing protein [Marinicella sp. S1101]|uniref:hemerythrin domain-containing protein n=1 Tax=Marinicella marina TaxID=2996016 RepID=UPI002260E326|nr:hemerythrin domain-containing protein [Marinicella marina]MCX7552918.1 hemerythrin domain-containing protein [Marinicella marina]MDJ1139773.1 hemerythrin domain-containing protein [Marinicella marina]
MSIYQAIEDDHDKQRDLLQQLVATSGDTSKRADIFKELKHELEVHADMEERHFYVPLIKEDKTQDDARHGIAEHHEIDELVKKVEQADPSSAAWLQHAKNLKHKVEHHLIEEEKDYFPVARDVLTDDRAESLRVSYEAGMDEARN